MGASCPWCGAPRGGGADCPKCGANYAKAERIKGIAPAPAAPPKPAAVPVPDDATIQAILETPDERAVEDPAFEFKLCVAAIPAMLALALFFHWAMPGVQRIFLGMPIHELGHAVTAWFCGYWAIPTLWKTIIPDERGFIAPILLAGAIGWMIWRAWLAEKMYLVAIGAVLLVVQAIGTLYIRESTAEMLFAFGGDGIGMVLATALMATFFFGKRSQLYKGALRWGFLAIGSAAFVDMFATWWRSLSDIGAIPYGEIEGVGLSDPARLVELHGWNVRVMVRRFVTLGACCLAALALVYAWGVRHAWLKAKR